MSLEIVYVSWRWDLGYEVRIWASQLGFGPQDWNLGPATGIWALRLGFESGEGRTDREEEEG